MRCSARSCAGPPNDRPAGPAAGTGAATAPTRCRPAAEALDEPFRAFPSWFMRITCDRCGKDRMVNEAHMRRGATCRSATSSSACATTAAADGREGGAAHRHRGRQQPAGAADRADRGLWSRTDQVEAPDGDCAGYPAAFREDADRVQTLGKGKRQGPHSWPSAALRSWNHLSGDDGIWRRAGQNKAFPARLHRPNQKLFPMRTIMLRFRRKRD